MTTTVFVVPTGVFFQVTYYWRDYADHVYSLKFGLSLLGLFFVVNFYFI